MTRVLFIQGGGAGTHDEWDSKLVDSLQRHLGDEYDLIYPRMPDEGDPAYERWKPAIEQELRDLSPGDIVVGHSLGGMMLVNVLAQMQPAPRLGGLVLLAAPFIGEGGWSSDDIEPMPGIGGKLPRDLSIHLYHGDDDDTVPVQHLDLYAAALPGARVHRLPKRDHQMLNDLAMVADDLRRKPT